MSTSVLKTMEANLIITVRNGMNYWMKQVKTIVITHKDRFIRFGYDWFERFCMKFHTTILVVNNEELSPQEELVQDIISILHDFCHSFLFAQDTNKL